MDLRVCRNFLTIVEEGSMNRAARRLHLTQPTLSRQIAQLEQELQVQLFERRSKSLRLTSQGRLFVSRAQEMLALEEKTRTELGTISQGIRGELTIGCGELVAVEQIAQITKAFVREYPDVQVSFITGTADQTRDLIDKGLIDLGIFLDPLSLDDFETFIWPQQESWTAILPVDHPLAGCETITPKDLCGEPLIFPYRSEPAQIVKSWFGEYKDSLHVTSRSSLSSNGAILCLAGFGILISLAGLPAYQNPGLKEIPLDPPVVSRVRLGWKSRFPASPLLERYLSWLMAHAGMNQE